MNNEFKIKQQDKAVTVYVLESASGGGTASGAGATLSQPIGGVQSRLIGEAPQDGAYEFEMLIINPAFTAWENGAGDENNPPEEELAVRVTYDVEGESRPATWGYHGGEPAEEPDVEIMSIYNVDTDEEISNQLDQPTLDRITQQAYEEMGNIEPDFDEPDDYYEGAKVDRQAKHITTSMMKSHPGMSKEKAQGVAWAHIKHPKQDEGFDGEYDDEAGMAHTDLHTIARAAQGLLDTIGDKENLPEWAQEKIAKVEGMLVAVWDYLKSQEEQGIDPQQDQYEGTGMSDTKLANYKAAASADASAADKAGNYARGNKRFSGIVKATIKQGDNAAKRAAPTAEGKKDRKDPIRTIKAKSPVAHAAQKVAKGAGAHKNPKDAVSQPRKAKHKQPVGGYVSELYNKLDSVLKKK